MEIIKYSEIVLKLIMAFAFPKKKKKSLVGYVCVIILVRCFTSRVSLLLVRLVRSFSLLLSN